MKMSLQSLDFYEVSFVYEGVTRYIEVFPFVASLGSFCHALKEIGLTLYPDYNVAIALKETRPGSFLVDLAFITAVSATLLQSLPVVDFAKQTLGTFIDLLELMKFLKGEPPLKTEEIEQGKVKVYNADNQILMVNQGTINIYGNVNVTSQITKGFDALEKAPDVEVFRIDDPKEGRTYKVLRKEFPYLSQITTKKTEEIKVDELNTFVKIIKPAFEKGLTWYVKIDEEKANVKILDDDFMEKIQNGLIRFGKGDLLEVKMEVESQFNPIRNDYEVKERRITKVLRFIPSPHQTDINFHLREY